MSVPEGHPEIHGHQGKTCPVTGRGNRFCPPQADDSRSVCPALNTMANHGYISRDGKNLSALDITRGLRACYNLSYPLAYFLAYVGYAILHKPFGRLSLQDIGKHNAVEHNASLVHHDWQDTPEHNKLAPIKIDQTLVDALCADVRPSAKEVEAAGPESGARFLINAVDVARARVRREKECGPIDSVHAEIARGEMAIILGVWEVKTRTKAGIPMEYFRRWISEERLPDDWKPDHAQGLLNTIKRSKSIRTAQAKFQQEEAQPLPTSEKN
ncbi:heme-thiolate peroxidase [Gymnopilus junonius]|uniref:Heme-thiolate peroxidase n=1 Tax=Gymnopilus junonius TaxID=109634 RepID=A0A9P5TQY4_GYMJU|nr:heme-thiolate peroxidase [Gymnopilus junonius]